MPSRQVDTTLKRERGAALVELAIVLPLLLTLFGGMVELGRAIYQYETLTKSARVAARYLSQYSALDPSYASTTIPAAQCLAVYGNTGCTGTPLATGLTTLNVVIYDQTSPTASQSCTGGPFLGYNVFDTNNNSCTGSNLAPTPAPQEAINLVEVKITGYTYSPLQSFFKFTGVTFGDISVVMRQS
jgi:Flp pilus assembly protein TadG